jgi:hypothetical protein
MATNPTQYPQANSADEQDQPKSAAFAKEFKYKQSQYESNKYKVTGLMYPDDLMSDPNINPYGGNKVVFYINTSVDSRIFKGTDAVAVVDGVQRNERSDLLAQKITNAQGIGAGTAAGAAVGAGAGQLLGIGGGAPGGAVGGAVVGGGGAAIIAGKTGSDQEVPGGAEKSPAFQRPQKRLEAAIALYIPNQLNIRYSIGWGEEDTMALSALAKGGEEIGRALQGEGDIKRTGGLVGDVLGAIAINNAPLGQALGVAAGLAANPKKEQAFKSVDFRTFTFDYQFAPRNQNEARNVMNIIRAFKYHMHPEFNNENKFLYIYPSEFDIAYYKGVNENLAIHRHTSCVLTEMNVNYTPNGVFTTFSDGTPTQMNVSLTFKELLLLSKETIERYL